MMMCTELPQQTSSTNISGLVFPRDYKGTNNGSDSSPAAQAPRCKGNDDSAVLAYAHPDVLCFASRNRRGRFFVPSKQNSFGGVQVDNVLFDAGCSTLLLPFPLENGFPPTLTDPSFCKWTVSYSRGTGAVHSPVLKIKKHCLGFHCTFADKPQPSLDMLRFHLGSKACSKLLQDDFKLMLTPPSIDKLSKFLRQIGNIECPERTYALLGQSYFSRVLFCQSGDTALALSGKYDGHENVVGIIGSYHQALVPLVKAFEEFHDLEDDDGDEDDEEDNRPSFEVPSSDEDEPDER
jgi:hypothetical protein